MSNKTFLFCEYNKYVLNSVGQSLLQKHCFSFISALFLKDLTKISLDYFRMFSNICIKIGGVFKIFTKIGKDGIRGC